MQKRIWPTTPHRNPQINLQSNIYLGVPKGLSSSAHANHGDLLTNTAIQCSPHRAYERAGWSSSSLLGDALSRVSARSPTPRSRFMLLIEHHLVVSDTKLHRPGTSSKNTVSGCNSMSSDKRQYLPIRCYSELPVHSILCCFCAYMSVFFEGAQITPPQRYPALAISIYVTQLHD